MPAPNYWIDCEFLFYVFAIAVSLFGMLGSVASAVIMIICRHVLNFNYMFLCMNWSAASSILSIGAIMYYSNLMGFHNDVEFWNRVSFASISYQRLIFLSIAIERGVATVRSHDYEHSTSYRWISPTLIIVSWFATIYHSVNVNVYSYSFWTVLSRDIAVDVLNVLVICGLLRQNRIMFRVLTNSLSQRYQISLNLRGLRLIVPLAISEMVFRKIGIIGYFILDNKERRRTYDNPRFAVAFFIFTLSVYVAVAGVRSVYLLIKKYNASTGKRDCDIFGTKASNVIQVSLDDTRKMLADRETSLYFGMLEKAWNNK